MDDLSRTDYPAMLVSRSCALPSSLSCQEAREAGPRLNVAVRRGENHKD